MSTERKVGTASLVQPNIVVPELKLNDILVPPENEDNASREMPVIVPDAGIRRIDFVLEIVGENTVFAADVETMFHPILGQFE